MNISNLSEKAQAFLAKKPYLLGCVYGDYYYEHPTQGDEGPMIVICKDGKKRLSDFLDLESVRQFGDEFIDQYTLK